MNDIVAQLQDWFTRAVALQPHSPAEAAVLYRRILSHAPAHADTWLNLALAERQDGRCDVALRDLDTALRNVGDEPRLLVAQAECLYQQDRWEEVIAALRSADRIAPLSVEARCLLGNALVKLERYDEAFDEYQRARTTAPSSFLPYCRLSALMIELGQYDDALNLAEQVARHDPANAEGRLALALALKALNRFDEAENELREALGSEPASADLWCNLGIVLQAQGKEQEALAAYDRALRQDADHLLARWNRALTLLSVGDYERGWAEYDVRWRAAINGKMSHFDCPEWRGEDVGGKTMLLHAEQGLGDSLQFLRYVPLVRALGAKIILRVPQPLRRLCENTWGDVLLERQEGEYRADLHAPLMSLPARFATTWNTIPAAVPYFLVPQADQFKWRALMPETEGLKVGLVWQGGPRKGCARSEWLDHRRSLPLERLLPLADCDDVNFFSVQKEHGREQLDALRERWPIFDLTESITDFADTAAFLMQLDLLISVDTSVAHLAGALGKPVWLLNRFDSDWRWRMSDDRSPWYPSVQIFRQTESRDWASVIADVRNQLPILGASLQVGTCVG